MPAPDSPTSRLLRFNRDVLAQALALAAAHETPGAPPYPRPVGAHLRHVIEHYEALLLPTEPGLVDYDARPRDTALEQDPRVAQQRLLGLVRTLQVAHALDAPLQVRGRGGVLGDFGFEVTSTLGRELVFLAGHAVHHYAVLMPHCHEHGITVSQHFGKAPATVAHELGLAVMKAPPAGTKVQINQELTCTTPTLTA